jgi:hypothetical protein
VTGLQKKFAKVFQVGFYRGAVYVSSQERPLDLSDESPDFSDYREALGEELEMFLNWLENNRL